MFQLIFYNGSKLIYRKAVNFEELKPIIDVLDEANINYKLYFGFDRIH